MLFRWSFQSKFHAREYPILFYSNLQYRPIFLLGCTSRWRLRNSVLSRCSHVQFYLALASAGSLFSNFSFLSLFASESAFFMLFLDPQVQFFFPRAPCPRVPTSFRCGQGSTFLFADFVVIRWKFGQFLFSFALRVRKRFTFFYFCIHIKFSSRSRALFSTLFLALWFTRTSAIESLVNKAQTRKKLKVETRGRRARIKFR